MVYAGVVEEGVHLLVIGVLGVQLLLLPPEGAVWPC
jgi:hypothetical protein